MTSLSDQAGVDAAVEAAFPGSSLSTHQLPDGRFALALRQPGLLRPLTPGELSDGTLRYLLLVAALKTTRPPGLMVLNEPETSLHPSLIGPLARLIGARDASGRVLTGRDGSEKLRLMTRPGCGVLAGGAYENS